MTNTEQHIHGAIVHLTNAIIDDATLYATLYATEYTAPSSDADRTDAALAAWCARIVELRAVRERLEEILRLGKLREYDPR